MARGDDESQELLIRRRLPRRRLPRGASVTTLRALPDALSEDPSPSTIATVTALGERALIEPVSMITRGGRDMLRLAELHDRQDAPCVKLLVRLLTERMLACRVAPLDSYATGIGVVPRVVENVCMFPNRGLQHLIEETRQRTLCGCELTRSLMLPYVERGVYRRLAEHGDRLRCKRCLHLAARGSRHAWPDPSLYDPVDFSESERTQLAASLDEGLLRELTGAETESDYRQVMSGATVRAAYRAAVAQWVEKRIEPELALARFELQAPALWERVLGDHYRRLPPPEPRDFTLFLEHDTDLAKIRHYAIASLFMRTWRASASQLQSEASLHPAPPAIRGAASAYSELKRLELKVGSP